MNAIPNIQKIKADFQAQLKASLPAAIPHGGDADHAIALDALTGWLEHTDFYTAPASARYHGAFTGGLALHSLNVARIILELQKVYPFTLVCREAALFCALTHDFCKIGKYQLNDSGNGYRIAEEYLEPFGHGGQSVRIIETLTGRQLPEDMAVAIASHMGPVDKGIGYQFTAVARKYPLAALLHIADLTAAALL